MPSSPTITAFYEFSPATKARSAQVTSNFSVFRGHIIPVETDTATAVASTYDLGSADYPWRNVYCDSITVSNGIPFGALDGIITYDRTTTAQSLATSYTTMAKFSLTTSDWLYTFNIGHLHVGPTAASFFQGYYLALSSAAHTNNVQINLLEGANTLGYWLWRDYMNGSGQQRPIGHCQINLYNHATTSTFYLEGKKSSNNSQANFNGYYGFVTQSI